MQLRRKCWSMASDLMESSGTASGEVVAKQPWIWIFRWGTILLCRGTAFSEPALQIVAYLLTVLNGFGGNAMHTAIRGVHSLGS
eukprot:1814312-Rhodomonas_salina.2